MQVTATVNEDIVERLDQFAYAQSRSRSNLIALILEKWALEQED
jgi:predicted transcriptional regulator